MVSNRGISGAVVNTVLLTTVCKKECTIVEVSY